MKEKNKSTHSSQKLMTEFGLSYLYDSYSELAEPGIKTGTLWFLGECASNCAILANLPEI